MREMGINLSEELRLKNSLISVDQIVGGELDRLVEKGLRVLTMCEHGVRSGELANGLNAWQHPAVVLENGLMGLRNTNEEDMTMLAEAIQNVPHSIVVLSEGIEINRHANAIDMLTRGVFDWFITQPLAFFATRDMLEKERLELAVAA